MDYKLRGLGSELQGAYSLRGNPKTEKLSVPWPVAEGKEFVPPPCPRGLCFRVLGSWGIQEIQGLRNSEEYV